jgi:hypothetical protein
MIYYNLTPKNIMISKNEKYELKLTDIGYKHLNFVYINYTV